MTQRIFGFDELEIADLVVDAMYEGGNIGDVRDDPLAKLLSCGNQGGFRIRKNANNGYCLAVLYSSLADPDWPDRLDLETGVFVSFGDNKHPGHELHDTPRGGNELLRYCFNAIHSSPPRREDVPPLFVFTKGTKGRDVVFRGLAVPGSVMVKPSEDLTAIWKSTGGQRFQNYQAYFTILNTLIIPRAWISDLLQGNPLSTNCPDSWRRWVETGKGELLSAEPTLKYRKKNEQLPTNGRNNELVRKIYPYFKDDSIGFEHCAAEIAKLMDPNIVSYDLMRHWRDGGRDALGLYRIGPARDAIKVEFALEAKCNSLSNGVGIRATSRLISRLRHRQFGILVTTSYLDNQAYKEIREDGHPIVVVSGNDIAEILVSSGMGTVEAVSKWLESNFPKRTI